MVCVKVYDFCVTVGDDGTGSQTTDFPVYGEVLRVDLKAATLKSSATVKGYEAGAWGAVGSRNDFCAGVGAGSAFAKVILPSVIGTDIAATGLTAGYWYVHPVVGGKLTIAVAAANAAEVVYARVYVKE
jgi:hypothetical protein